MNSKLSELCVAAGYGVTCGERSEVLLKTMGASDDEGLAQELIIVELGAVHDGNRVSPYRFLAPGLRWWAGPSKSERRQADPRMQLWMRHESFAIASA